MNETGFPEVPIGTVAQLNQRAETTEPSRTYRQIGVKLWGTGAYERESVKGTQTKYKTLFLMEEGDIVVNKIWARNGSVAVVTKELAGSYGSNEFPTFTPDRNQLDSKWFHWITKSRFFWERCDEQSRGTSGQNRIKPEKFLKIHVPLPPLSEQRRIVARLEHLSSKIEEARGLQAKAGKEAQVLERALIDETIKQSGVGVDVVTVKDVARSITDGDHQPPPKTTSGIPFIFISNIKGTPVGRLDLTDSSRVSQEYYAKLAATRQAQRGDILYTAVGSYGIPCLVETNDAFCFQRHVAIIKPNRQKILPKYLVWALASREVYQQATKFATGTAQLTVPLRGIRALKIPLPGIAEQRRIVEYLDNSQEKVSSLKQLQAQTRGELDALLPSVLDKAFRGEL